MKTTTTVLSAAMLAALTALPTRTLAQADVVAQCSGIGEEERAMAESVPYTLKLVYAQPDGHYLGNVGTRISRSGETVADVQCPGPWVLANLPDGTYEVTATFEGQTKSARVTISGGHKQQQVFTF